MSSVELTTLDGPEKTPPAPVGMVSHLKHLIESLPVCVMRTDLNGCLLAANDSALQLLGATEHAKVLTKSLTERISAEHTDDWRSFLQRSWSEGAGSLECELIAFNGAHRIILIKSVAQPTHVDGIQSLILTAQDLASRRRLELVLNEHQGCAATIGALQEDLQRSEADRQRLVRLLESSQTQTGPAAADDAASDALKRQVEELHAALASKDAMLVSKEKEWEERTNEQRRLAELAADRNAEHEALEEALRNRLTELEGSIAAKDEDWQKRCDTLAVQIAEQAAEREKLTNALQASGVDAKRLSELVDERNAEHQKLSGLLELREAEQKAACEALQQRVTELEHSLKAAEQEWQRRSDDMAAALADHATARVQLTNALAERDVDHRTTADALRQRIQELEQNLTAAEENLKIRSGEWQKRCDELTAQLATASAERERLANVLEQRSTDQRTAGDTLQERIANLESTLKASQEAWQKQRAELSAELITHLTEQERLSIALKQREDEQRALTERLKEGEDERQRMTEALKQREDEYLRATEERTHQHGEYQRLSELLKQREDEHQKLSRSLKQREDEQQKLSELLKQYEDEHQRLSGVLKQRDGEHQRFSELLKQRDSEHQRLSELLKQRDEEYQRVSTTLKQREEEHQRLFDSLKQRDGEHDRQGELLTQLEHERRRLADELSRHERERQQLTESLKHEQDKRQEVSELLTQQESERKRLSESLQQLEAERQKLAELLEHRDAEHEATVEELHRQIVECERALAASDESWKARCEELSNEVITKDHERTRRWEELTAQLREHAAERQRLSEELQHHEAERDRLVEKHENDKIRIEQSVRGECERTQARVDETRRVEIDDLRHDIRQLVDDLQGTAAQLDQRTIEYDLLMEQATTPVDPDSVVDPADVERLMKSVAAYRIELVQVTENTIRTLEPMATAGRVAIASSRELQVAVEAVDVRSRELLERCALDDVNRPELERLRRDSIGAASLVRQLLQVFGESTRLAGHGGHHVVEETH